MCLESLGSMSEQQSSQDSSDERTDVEISIAKFMSFRFAASESTLARFLPVPSDELTTIRRDLLRITGKSLVKKFKYGVLDELTPLERLVMENALGDLISQQVKRLGNRVDTQVRIGELLGSSQINEVTSDHDSSFLAERFWEEVGDVSDEEVRKLYAKVAVRELKSPSSVSLNTLSILRRMDAKTVHSLETTASFLCDGHIVLPSRKDSGLSNAFIGSGLGQTEISHLTAVGLFTSRLGWKPRLTSVQEGQQRYVFWQMSAGLVRIPVTSKEKQRPNGDVNPWEQIGLGDFVALEATTAALELISAVMPPIREDFIVPIATSIGQSLRMLGILSPNGRPEISRDKGRTWDDLPGTIE
jgi:hypothetical protein